MASLMTVDILVLSPTFPRLLACGPAIFFSPLGLLIILELYSSRTHCFPGTTFPLVLCPYLARIDPRLK